MKRSFSFNTISETSVMVSGVAFIAATYGLVRLAYGLFLPDVRADIGMSSGAAGLVSSGSSLFYCAAAVAGLVLGGRGARGQIVAAMASGVVGVWGMAAADDVAWFAVSAIVGSAGAGLASPALVTIVRRSTAPVRLARAQSVVNAGTGPGVVAAGVLALVMLPHWRTAWWVVGVLTMGIAVSVVAADRGPAPTRDVGSVAVDRSWLRAHAAPAVAAVLMGAGSSSVWTYGRGVLVDAGVVGERGSVGAWVLLGVGATAVIVTAGPMSRLVPTGAWTLTCAVMVASVAALGLGREHIAVGLVACAGFGWGFTAATSALIAWSARIDLERAARGTALLFVALVFGQAVGAATLGALIDAGGYAVAFLIAAGACAIAVAPALSTGRLRTSSGRLRTSSGRLRTSSGRRDESLGRRVPDVCR